MDRLRDMRRKLRERLHGPRRQDAFLPGQDVPPTPVEDGCFLVPPGNPAPGPPMTEPVGPPTRWEPTTPRSTPDGGGSFLPPTNPSPPFQGGDQGEDASESVSFLPSASPGSWEQPDRSHGSYRTYPQDERAPTDAAVARPSAMTPATSHDLVTAWGPCLHLTPTLPLALPAPLPAVSGNLALAELLACCPERVVFLDLETCGLNDVPLFLVGTLRAEALGLYLARRTAEEPAVIAAVAELLGQAEAVVTFNGAGFDIPFLQRRAARFQIELRLPRLHLDLLPICRGVYGKRHGNCKLQTLERAVCGLVRDGDDVPSSEVPRVYERFCRDGDQALIAPVLYHNAMDLVAAAHLLARLAGG